MKEARKPLYQEMYRDVHGRRISWIHDVEEATPEDYRAVYDAGHLTAWLHVRACEGGLAACMCVWGNDTTLAHHQLIAGTHINCRPVL